MKYPTIAAAATLAWTTLILSPAYAGKEFVKMETPGSAGKVTVDAKETASKEVVEAKPIAGSLTLGAQFSEDLSGVFVDAISGLWSALDRDGFLFLDTRFDWEDNDQTIFSAGLGFRQMVGNGRAIIGGNVFWDAIDSAHGQELHQLGLGFEVLSRWVDFRFNYYLPENGDHEIGRSSRRERSSDFGPAGFEETTRTFHYRRYEAGLEGLNTELGFLVPGLDRYAEVRLFAGYYRYNNPFGGDFEGFKARLEARVLRGVIADLEYWDDEALNGGHWTGGVRVSLPFTLGNLFAGKNPFEGAADAFKPGPRDFQDRMGEMVIRSHRIHTATSGDVLAGERVRTRVEAVPVVEERRGGGPPVVTGGAGFPLE